MQHYEQALEVAKAFYRTPPTHYVPFALCENMVELCGYSEADNEQISEALYDLLKEQVE